MAEVHQLIIQYGIEEARRQAGVISGSLLDAMIALWRDTPKSADLPGRRSALTFVRHKAAQNIEHSEYATVSLSLRRLNAIPGRRPSSFGAVADHSLDPSRPVSNDETDRRKSLRYGQR